VVCICCCIVLSDYDLCLLLYCIHFDFGFFCCVVLSDYVMICVCCCIDLNFVFALIVVVVWIICWFV
jgi:hypothetical protein